MNNIIYHYCSVEAFLSIIQNKKIWLSSSLTTNDYLENKLILLKVEKFINEEDIKYKDIFQKFYQSLYLNVQGFYISCFSENGDMLSQWRAYTNDGLGVSIGFDVNSLPSFDRQIMMHSDPKECISTKKVIYDENMLDKVIKDMIIQLKVDNLKEETILNSSLSLSQLSYMSKSDAFEEEKEIRVIYRPLTQQFNIEPFDDNISEIKFRMNNYSLSSYFEMDIPYNKKCRNPILEIILGPKNKIHIKELEHLLRINGFKDVKIIRSRIPYI